uniref:Uncharacterized protein n=1 Tax=Bacillus cereus TaxID=1396 RepID=A1BZ88_BACCE|nr:hypothetical protein pPER272_AH820_0058 [Bacillus cereus]ABK01190.1 hypothetical protein pPER272_0058 [Bacillus cereus]
MLRIHSNGYYRNECVTIKELITVVITEVFKVLI